MNRYYRTDMYYYWEAKKLRNNKAKELRKNGYTVKCGFSAGIKYDTYWLKATKKEV